MPKGNVDHERNEKAMKAMPTEWQYRIEAYRWDGDGAWTPVMECDADTWFLLGERKKDTRVFGLFSSRAEANDTAQKLASGRMGETYRGVVDQCLTNSDTSKSYDQMRADGAQLPASGGDKGIDR